MSIHSTFLNLLGLEWTTRFMTFYNLITDATNFVVNHSKNAYMYVNDYMNGRHDMWFFFGDNVGPIQGTFVSHEMSGKYLKWLYNTNENSLTFCENVRNESDDSSERDVTRFIPWLSAQIVSGRKRYDIDNFLANFRFICPENIYPSPKLIISCWSIQNKIWFVPSQEITLEIIDSNGDTHMTSVFTRNSIERDMWNRLFEDIEFSESSEEEEQEEQEDAEDAEEAEEQEDAEDAEEEEDAEEVEDIDSGNDADTEDNEEESYLNQSKESDDSASGSKSDIEVIKSESEKESESDENK